jgi:hypothetical protein
MFCPVARSFADGVRFAAVHLGVAQTTDATELNALKSNESQGFP